MIFEKIEIVNFDVFIKVAWSCHVKIKVDLIKGRRVKVRKFLLIASVKVKFVGRMLICNWSLKLVRKVPILRLTMFRFFLTFLFEIKFIFFPFIFLASLKSCRRELLVI